MRSILALGLLITLFAFADSAAASHSQRQVRAKRSVTVGTVPGFANAPAVRYPAPSQPSPYDNRYPNWGGM
jgi:hypothetical protein